MSCHFSKYKLGIVLLEMQARHSECYMHYPFMHCGPRKITKFQLDLRSPRERERERDPCQELLISLHLDKDLINQSTSATSPPS